MKHRGSETQRRIEKIKSRKKTSLGLLCASVPLCQNTQADNSLFIPLSNGLSLIDDSYLGEVRLRPEDQGVNLPLPLLGKEGKNSSPYEGEARRG
ncbi:MAG: hypothetical protein A3G18_06760 [Rhodospirillales bacterium RIFCSPLOWO2_12_FULL_58_28]|nr:MAG: hypothetical protein A3H92_11325 [Rhodospirillales bacterium RIFCSPLOWO2_02_FULL_58_16]OHC77423.1 MAG: hypothetical protein A3G18_06760 [Rhodospirillales bacterium RIFCSPLOWO2_12_FULL_58_28]